MQGAQNLLLKSFDHFLEKLKELGLDNHFDKPIKRSQQKKNDAAASLEALNKLLMDEGKASSLYLNKSVDIGSLCCKIF